MIVEGKIGPIRADKIRFDRLTVPLIMPEVFRVQFTDVAAGRVTEGTIEHARAVAERIKGTMANLPHTPESGDLLALAFAVLHFTGGAK